MFFYLHSRLLFSFKKKKKKTLQETRIQEHNEREIERDWTLQMVGALQTLGVQWRWWRASYLTLSNLLHPLNSYTMSNLGVCVCGFVYKCVQMRATTWLLKGLSLSVRPLRWSFTSHINWDHENWKDLTADEKTSVTVIAVIMQQLCYPASVQC